MRLNQSDQWRSAQTGQRRRRLWPRGILAGAAAVAGTVVIAVGAAGGTYALWTQGEDTNAASIRTGSIDLLINNESHHVITGLDLTRLLPGESVVAPLTISNNGSVPMSVARTNTQITSSNPALSSYLAVSMRIGATCLPTPAATPLPNGATLIDAATPLLPGAATAACLEVRLLSPAPSTVAGSTATVNMQLTGTQVRP